MQLVFPCLADRMQDRWKVFSPRLNFTVSMYNNVLQAESLKYKLLGGLAVRRACYGVLRFIMESGAKGAEVRSGRC